MLKRAPLLLLVLLCVVCPVLADQEDEPTIVGAWLLVGFEVNGEAQEDDDAGHRIIVFTEDGLMRAYEDAEAFDEGEADDNGWFELTDEGKFTVFEDRNENGELDEAERDGAEGMMLDWVEGNPVLSTSIDAGDQKVELKIILARHK